MCIHVVVRSATGETTAVVAAFQCPANGRWNAAAFAADVQEILVFGFVPVHDAAIASQASGRFRGDLCAGIQPTFGTFAVLAQRIQIGVYVNGRSLATIGAGLTAQKPFGDARQGVGPALGD